MSDVVLLKQEVKQGKVGRLKEWMKEIQTRKDEAVETLRNEGVHTESAFLETSEDGTFLYYYIEAENIQTAMSEFEHSSHELDQQHQRVMEDVLVNGEDVGEFELLYHVADPDR